MESGTNDVEYLHRLLDYASGLILKLGSPARDSTAKAAHQSLVTELSTLASPASKDAQKTFFTTLVKGLRFIFEQLQVRFFLHGHLDLSADSNCSRQCCAAPVKHLPLINVECALSRPG